MIGKSCEIDVALPCWAPEYVQGRYCISGVSIVIALVISFGCAGMGLGSG